MKLSNLILLISVTLLLTGCPGDGDRLPYDHWGWIFVTPGRVCFSINKEDIITSYHLESRQKNKNIVILNSSSEKNGLSYPHTCFDITLTPGYIYWSTYILNGIKYRYEFFIDNNWHITSLEGK